MIKIVKKQNNARSETEKEKGPMMQMVGEKIKDILKA